MTIQQEAEKNIQRGEMSEDSVAAFYEAKQGQIMEHLWKLNVADIENTLTRVVDRVSLLLSTRQSHTRGLTWSPQMVPTKLGSSARLLAHWSGNVGQSCLKTCSHLRKLDQNIPEASASKNVRSFYSTVSSC